MLQETLLISVGALGGGDRHTGCSSGSGPEEGKNQAAGCIVDFNPGLELVT